MNYCNLCGSKLFKSIPPGDTHQRDVCTRCGHIHYQNPKIVCGCIASYEDKVLLCNRAIEPRKGFWTLPAGYLENGETITEGALRECEEEAGATLENPQLYSIFSITRIHQVYIFFRGGLDQGHHAPGEESLETTLFHLDSIPWDKLAFPAIYTALKLFVEDYQKQSFPIHSIDL